MRAPDRYRTMTAMSSFYRYGRSQNHALVAEIPIFRLSVSDTARGFRVSAVRSRAKTESPRPFFRFPRWYRFVMPRFSAFSSP